MTVDALNEAIQSLLDGAESMWEQELCRDGRSLAPCNPEAYLDGAAWIADTPLMQPLRAERVRRTSVRGRD